MSQPVFLNYDQAALDRQYDQSVWAPNQPQIKQRFESLSHEIRQILPFEEYAYGPSEQQRLDWYAAPAKRRGIVVFVHGGAWRSGLRADYAFPAQAMHANDCDLVVVGFDLVPAVTLQQQAEQVIEAILWICNHARQLTDADLPIILTGQSSGAHLLAQALTDPRIAAQPAIRCAVCISGSYDLHAVRLSARNLYLKLDPADVEPLSPLRHIERISVPVFVARSDGESDEFARQSDTFRDALHAAGKLGAYHVAANMNHFEVMELLRESDGWLARAALPPA